MNTTTLILSLAIAALAFAVPGAAAADAAGNAPVKSVMDATLTSADGKPYPLSQHHGQVILLVKRIDLSRYLIEKHLKFRFWLPIMPIGRYDKTEFYFFTTLKNVHC